MFIHGPSTHFSCECVDIPLMYVRRISSPGLARITGGSSCPAKENAAFPVSGSLIAVNTKGERVSGGSGKSGGWLTLIPGTGICAFSGKPTSKPKGKLHPSKLLHLSRKKRFAFISPKFRETISRSAGMFRSVLCLLDERSWRIDSCPSTAKGLYQHYRRHKALAADLCSGPLIGENGFLCKDNVEIADKSGFIALRSDLFRLSGVPYCTIFRLRFTLQIMQCSYLILNFLIGDEDGLFVLCEILSIPRLGLGDPCLQPSSCENWGHSRSSK